MKVHNSCTPLSFFLKNTLRRLESKENMKGGIGTDLHK